MQQAKTWKNVNIVLYVGRSRATLLVWQKKKKQKQTNFVSVLQFSIPPWLMMMSVSFNGWTMCCLQEVTLHPPKHTRTHIHTHTQTHTHTNIHTHTHTHTLIQTYTHRHRQTHTDTHTRTHTLTHTHTNIHTHTNTHIQTYTHSNIYTQTHKHTQTYTHTNIYTQTHTHTELLLFALPDFGLFGAVSALWTVPPQRLAEALTSKSDWGHRDRVQNWDFSHAHRDTCVCACADESTESPTQPFPHTHTYHPPWAILSVWKFGLHSWNPTKHCHLLIVIISLACSLTKILQYKHITSLW